MADSTLFPKPKRIPPNSCQLAILFSKFSVPPVPECRCRISNFEYPISNIQFTCYRITAISELNSHSSRLTITYNPSSYLTSRSENCALSNSNCTSTRFSRMFRSPILIIFRTLSRRIDMAAWIPFLSKHLVTAIRNREHFWIGLSGYR